MTPSPSSLPPQAWAALGAVGALALEWVGRIAWTQYRLYLGRKAAEAEQTESTADDEAVQDAIERLEREKDA